MWQSESPWGRGRTHTTERRRPPCRLGRAVWQAKVLRLRMRKPAGTAAMADQPEGHLDEKDRERSPGPGEGGQQVKPGSSANRGLADPKR